MPIFSSRFVSIFREPPPPDYLSPINEPQWNWGASNNQEGTAASNTDMANLVKTLGPDLQTNGVNTHVVTGEAGQITFLNTPTTDNRGDQINQWFNPADSNYIGGIPNVDNTISYHSYFTTCPDNTLVSDRQAVATIASNSSIKLWMTESSAFSKASAERSTGIQEARTSITVSM